MTDPDRLAERLAGTWLDNLSEGVTLPLHSGTAEIRDTAVPKTLEVHQDDDWLATIESQLFEQLWNSAGITTSQGAHVIDVLNDARSALVDADYGGENTLWLLHPKTEHEALNEVMELVYLSDPTTMREYPTAVSPAFPTGRAVLVDPAALAPNPQADIPGALSAWDDDHMAIDVLSPFTVHDNAGIVAVEFDLEDL